MLEYSTECKRRALICAEHARTSLSPQTRQKFADLAKTWLMLAAQVEDEAAQFFVRPVTRTKTHPAEW